MVNFVLKTRNYVKESFKDQSNEYKANTYMRLYSKSKNIKQEVEHFFNRPEVWKPSIRSNDVSIMKRIEGNEKLKEKKYKESLSLYTQSIYNAEKSHECLSLAYANRSVVLMKMGHFSESLQDIEIALENGYPEDKVHTLILRKAKCLTELGDFNEARKVLEKSLKNCESKGVHIIKEELSKLKGKKNVNVSETKVSNIPQLAGGENKDFASASNYINVMYDDKKGRHVIANRDIEIGEVLFVEKPFSFLPYGQVCDTCCKNTIAPIPCWNCQEVFYCSPKCRDESWRSIHCFVCGSVMKLKEYGQFYLSLRVVLTVSSTIEELKRKIQNEIKLYDPGKQKPGFISFASKGYDSVCSLLTNIEKYELDDLFDSVEVSVWIAFFIKDNTNYFLGTSDDDDFMLLASTILRHTLQASCNGVTVKLTEHVLNVSQNKLPIVGFYPSSSMMNHSCLTSVAHRPYGGTLVLVASKPIRKGEEVFTCYLGDCEDMLVYMRQNTLSETYFFKCDCASCVKPTRIKGIKGAFKCLNCKGPVQDEIKSCLVCGEVLNNVEEMERKENLFHALIMEGKFLAEIDAELALKKFLEAWWTAREIYYKFNIYLAYSASEVSLSFLKVNDLRNYVRFYICFLLSMEKCNALGLSQLVLKFALKITSHFLKAVKPLSKETRELQNYCLEYFNRYLILTHGSWMDYEFGLIKLVSLLEANK